jgi:hypothetical protein
MGFLDKAKAAAEQAANRAKEGVEEVQSKRNLSHTYEELGRTAFDLIEEGQISHDRMTGLADEIRKLRAATASEPVAGAAGASETPPPA